MLAFVIFVGSLAIFYYYNINFSILGKNYLSEYKKVRRIIHTIFEFLCYDLRNKEYTYAIILLVVFIFYVVVPTVMLLFFDIKKFDIKNYISSLYWFSMLIPVIFIFFLLISFSHPSVMLIFLFIYFFVLVLFFDSFINLLVFSYTINNTTSYFSNSSNSIISEKLLKIKEFLVLYLISVYFFVLYLTLEAIINNFFTYLNNLIKEKNEEFVKNKDKLPVFSLLVDDKVIEGKIVKIDLEECEFEIETEDNKKHIIPWKKIKEFFSIKCIDSYLIEMKIKT